MASNLSDEKWSEVLGGSISETEAGISIGNEAATLRVAIQNRINSRPTHTPTESGFARLLDRAKQADLIRASNNTIESTILARLRKILEPLSLQATDGKMLAAAFSPGVLLGAISGIPDPVFRGGSETTRIMLLVSDPLDVSLLWQRELTKRAIDHATVILGQNRYLIHFALNKDAEDLLIEHDIPPPSGLVCTLVIESSR